MRNAVLMAVMVTILTGCGKQSAVKYDAVKDSSAIHATVRGVKPGQDEPELPAINLLLTGQGKYPEKWTAALFVTHRNAKGEPDFWGERPTFAINPGNAFETVFKEHRFVDTTAEPRSFDDEVMFGMSLEDLIKLLDCGGKFSLNDKPFVLTQSEQDTITQAIVAAREQTNEGK